MTITLQPLYILSISCLCLLACAPRQTFVLDTKVNYVRMDNKATADSSINAFIAPYRQQIEAQMNEVVGEVPVTLTRKQPESTLGNWAADTYYEETSRLFDKKIDFACINQNGLRLTSIPQGKLTKGKLFELMPFDNQAVVIAIDGATLNQFLNHIAAKGSWHISKGLRFEIQNTLATNVTIAQQPIDTARIYYVAMSDYIANGGDNCDFLIGKPQTNLNKLARDIFIEGAMRQTQSGRPITAVVDGRCK